VIVAMMLAVGAMAQPPTAPPRVERFKIGVPQAEHIRAGLTNARAAVA